MKDALGWADEVTFCKASAALFRKAQRMADNWAVLYKTSHEKTWTYHKKKTINDYGNMQDSRSYIEAMFGVKQRTDNFANMDALIADIVDAFKIVQDTLSCPNAQTVIVHGSGQHRIPSHPR